MVRMFEAPSKRTYGLELPRREIHVTCEHFRGNRMNKRQTCVHCSVLLVSFLLLTISSVDDCKVDIHMSYELDSFHPSDSKVGFPCIFCCPSFSQPTTEIV